MNQTITARLKAKMDAEKMSFPKLEALTGIPSARMYKWYKQKTQPKHEDAVIIEKYLNNTLDKYPEEENKEQEVNYKDKYLHTLEQQLERREQELKEKGALIEALLKEVKTDLQFIKTNWIAQHQSRNLIAAMQQGYTDYFVEKLLKESPAKVMDAVKDAVNRKVVSKKDQIGKKGNQIQS